MTLCEFQNQGPHSFHLPFRNAAQGPLCAEPGQERRHGKRGPAAQQSQQGSPQLTHQLEATTCISPGVASRGNALSAHTRVTSSKAHSFKPLSIGLVCCAARNNR